LGIEFFFFALAIIDFVDADVKLGPKVVTRNFMLVNAEKKSRKNKVKKILRKKVERIRQNTLQD
jgi:predicted Ser/Thr protein kinase